MPSASGFLPSACAAALVLTVLCAQPAFAASDVNGVIDSIRNWVAGVLAALATPSFDLIPEVATTWELVRNVADSLLLLGVTAVGILVMAAGSDARYSAKVLIPRLAIAGIAANASLAACGALIRFENGLVVS